MKQISQIMADLITYFSRAGDDVQIVYDYADWKHASKAIIITALNLNYRIEQDLDLTIHRTLTLTALCCAKDFDTLNGIIDALSSGDDFEGDTVALPLIESVSYAQNYQDVKTAEVTFNAEIRDYGG